MLGVILVTALDRLASYGVILSAADRIACDAICGVEGPLLPPMRYERKTYYVYIMDSLSGTLYIGMTSKLHARAFEHKFHRLEGFTDKYDVERLLYWESFDDVHKAIAREKQLKGWRRSKKIALIEAINPHWLDLAHDWFPWMTNSGESRGASTPPNDSLRESSRSAQHDKEERVAET